MAFSRNQTCSTALRVKQRIKEIKQRQHSSEFFQKEKKNSRSQQVENTHGMHTQSLSEYGHVFNANSFRKNTLRFLLNNIPILIESQTSSCLVFMGLVLVFFSSFTFANIVQYTIASIVKWFSWLGIKLWICFYFFSLYFRVCGTIL